MPNLQDLYLAMPWEGDITALLENLPEGIRHIKLDEVYHTPSANPDFTPTVFDEDIAKVISLSSQWIHIELYAESVESKTMAAIADHCEHLETLKLVGDESGECTGASLQAVLNKAPKLKCLDVPTLDNERAMITAGHILSSEWASVSLEYLNLKIIVHERMYGNPHNTADQSSREIQRQVLRRLGQQKQLRKLVLGGMFYSQRESEHFYQFSCLEMTLESGLDELAGLKDLEKLYIHQMDHRIGIAELEWMAKHFPKLRKLWGLRVSSNPLSPEIEEWLLAHRPGWT
ncbi:hypothetical protein BGW41_003098 [Actinomortierella wolfii]|nr:hypothetical protein BGW41_003098 [Actinomortierella wolfii]